MVTIPTSPHYHKNTSRSGKNPPCIVCGKGISLPNPPYIHMTVDGKAVTPEEARTLDPNESQGCFPIGADCLRNNPQLKPYVLR